MIDIIHYGLTLVDKTKYHEIIFDEEKEDESKTNENDITMKLSNFDGGYLENVKFFRTDRDRVSVILPLSRFIMNLSALYCELTKQSFDQLITKLYDKYSETDNNINIYLNNWVDYSLRFITIFDEFHSYGLKIETFRTII